ncbi:hypothetical protein [Luteibacter jiangsuensis]|jgi:hypothetical protein
MSNVIDFLARMGADATLHGADANVLGHELANAAVDEHMSAAIIARDDGALRASVAPGKFYGIQLVDC